MSIGTFILCSVLAAFCGFLAQQATETFVNTSLVLLPFNIRTVK